MDVNEVQLANSPESHDEVSRLDVLSLIAKLDALKDIASLEELSENETTVIELLNHYSKLSGDTPETAQAARGIIVACRQSQLRKSGKSNSKCQSSSPFDRLIYLLDRYIDYCTSIKLSAWPIDHLKVSIWIKNDVTLTTNSTRMKPLRKTVRCYVTSLESIRIKTLHLFKGIHLAVHLMKSNIIMEILKTLSVERDNLEERLGISQPSADKMLVDVEVKNQRDFLLSDLRSRSGDMLAKTAIDIVKASRSGEQSENGYRSRSKTADPHIHTLMRYRNYCFLNKIPMWPIDAPKVGLWLKESVLVSEPRSKNKKTLVSFRTVQVYISRLEYARLKTEHLFPEFANSAGSLYKADEIVAILKQLHSPKKAQQTPEADDLQDAPSEDLRASSPSCDQTVETIPKSAGLRSVQVALPGSLGIHSKKRKSSATRNFSPRKLPRCDIENSPQLQVSEEANPTSVQPRFVLRDSNGRRTPSLRMERDHSKLIELANVALVNSSTAPTRSKPQFPSISEWFSPPPSPAKKTKGCISFILCSDEESEQSFNSAASHEAITPLGSPTRRFEPSRKVISISPSRLLESPTCNRFWINPLTGFPQSQTGV